MEQSISSLTFRGSIPEAIAEAKLQKKIFLVYISGEDADSIHMKDSTWTDSKVAESVSKYCVFLHLEGRSDDATNFSRIYPQNSVPSITAVGFNGIKIWQHEGYIDAEAVASSLEKAWLSLHIQETTASVMAAALAGRTSESSTTHPQSSIETSNERTGSISTVPSPSTHQKHSSGTSTTIKNKENPPVNGKSVKESSRSSTEPVKEQSGSAVVEAHDCVKDNHYTDRERDCPSSKLKADSEIREDPRKTGGSSDMVLPEEKLDSFEEETITQQETPSAPTSSRSSDVLLNIRLPEGVSLQEKFPVTSNLRTVKHYVDENRAGNNSPYDLATPYPRKVFHDEDLSKSLAELDLLGRQVLILVPRDRTGGYSSRGSAPSPFNHTESAGASLSNQDSEGYFAFARRVLSYFNPFSYLGGGGNGGSSSSGQDANAGTPGNLQGRLYSEGSTSQDTTRSRKLTTSRFGSNIHTLKHDDDESQFRDRNSFWNGNSTEYGGNNDDRR